MAALSRANWLGLAALLALPACTGLAEGPATWTGAAQSSDLALAVVEQDGAVTAYACGGPTSYASSTRWFHGTADASGRFAMTSDGWSIEGTTGTEATGTLTGPDGVAHAFSLAPRAQGSAEGLYSVQDAGCRTGVVVWGEDGGALRAQGTWCDEADHFAQVTPVMPIDPSSGGVSVRVDLSALGQGVRELFAAAAAR
jgi:hypothetical protein